MRARTFLLMVGACASAAAIGLSACGGDDSTAQPSADAAPESAADVDAGGPDEYVPPLDATMASCVLDNGTDPVELCTQKVVLNGLHESVFVPATGVLASWDSTTFEPDKDDAGTPLHDFHDDVAFGSIASAFGINARTYGDSELSPTLDNDLIALVPIIEKELATPPDEYSGELYQHLRDIAVGLRFLSENDDANAMDQIADAYGMKILAHFVSLSATDGVLASTATQDYAPGDVATGALALLDMVVRHAPNDAGVPDAGAVDIGDPSKWIAAAQASLDHIHDRGRDPVTHMYNRLLVPSGAVGRDDISPRAPVPADELTSDVAGTVALALLRASDLVVANPGPLGKLSAYPFILHADDAIASVNAFAAPVGDAGVDASSDEAGAGDAGDASAIDGGDAGDASAVDAGDGGASGAAPSLWDPVNNGYMEGYVPSTNTIVTNKPTRSNALLMAALHRANIVGLTPYGSQINLLRSVVGALTPTGTGLVNALDGQSGYFTELSKTFTLLDTATGILHPKSYSSAAVTIACEGLNEQWVDVAH